MKKIQFIGVFVTLFLGLFACSVKAQVSQTSIGDYHFKYYSDVQGSLEGFEAFTKVPDKNVFMGVSCSLQGSFPLIQVILFDDNVVSESPKLLSVELQIDGKTIKPSFNGILQLVDSADEFSNKIRLEVPTQRGQSFKTLQQSYMNLLEQLRQAQRVKWFIKHRTLETREVEFSLKGLGRGLQGRSQICF